MNRDRVYLKHILDAIARIESYVVVGRDVFMATPHWQDGVIRQKKIVGEATKRLSLESRSRYPDLPWRRIAGLRDVFIHNYMGVDLAAVWEVTQRELPILKKRVTELLNEIDDHRD